MHHHRVNVQLKLRLLQATNSDKCDFCFTNFPKSLKSLKFLLSRLRMSLLHYILSNSLETKKVERMGGCNGSTNERTKLLLKAIQISSIKNIAKENLIFDKLNFSS